MTTNKSIFIGVSDNIYDSMSKDVSVSIISENSLRSIEVERLDKLKHSTIFKYGGKYTIFQYLKQSLEYLDLFNLGKDINLVNFPINYSYLGDVHSYSEHHHLHAYSSYFSSNYNKSAILVVDGSGYSKSLNKELSYSIFYAIGNDIKFIKYGENIDSETEKQFGIGIVYYYISLFIGLEEGSVMGLSAYGDSNRFDSISLFDNNINGSFFNEKYAKILLSSDTKSWFELFTNIFGVTDNDFINKDLDITKSIFADIAAKLQKDTEIAMVNLANITYNLTKSSNLCLSGGVCLNILSNTEILKKTPFKNVYVPPFPYDGGISIGSVYYGYHIIGGNKNRLSLKNVGLGKSYSDSFILKDLEKYKDYLEYNVINDFSFVANLLNDDKIVGFFQGGSEIGPRALGFRSILGSPKNIFNKDRINKIKGRELWRPLAPSILIEYLSDYFDTSYPSHYMTFSAKVNNDKILSIPGVVHVDGTARYHTVDKDYNIYLHNLINYFYELSGIPVLINTSFNVKGQPIVESPDDAIKMFLSTDIDFLCIGNYIVSKKNIYEKFRFDKNLLNKSILNKVGKFNDIYRKKKSIIKMVIFKGLNLDIIEDDLPNEFGYIFKFYKNSILNEIFVGLYYNENIIFKVKDIIFSSKFVTLKKEEEKIIYKNISDYYELLFKILKDY